MTRPTVGANRLQELTKARLERLFLPCKEGAAGQQDGLGGKTIKHADLVT